jgi:hypothetical protein
MAAPVVPIVFGGLIAWSIYRRIRRNIGRQPLRPVRITISIVILTLVSLLFCGMAIHSPHLLLGIGGGLSLGAALGFVGLRLTKFETTNEGHFYTPNTPIGVGLSVLFVGRILYRFWAVRNLTAAPSSPPPFQSPLTFFIFGLIAGYYLVFYIGLFVHTHDKKPIAAAEN